VHCAIFFVLWHCELCHGIFFVLWHCTLCCSVLLCATFFCSCHSNFFAPEAKKKKNFVHGSSETMLAVAASCTGSVSSHGEGFILLPQGH